MINLQFRTRCGCSRVMQYPSSVPPPSYVLPMVPAPRVGMQYFDGVSVEIAPEQRTFRYTGHKVMVGGMLYYDYEEV